MKALIKLALVFLLVPIFSVSAQIILPPTDGGTVYGTDPLHAIGAGAVYRGALGGSESGIIEASPKNGACDENSPDRQFCQSTGGIGGFINQLGFNSNSTNPIDSGYTKTKPAVNNFEDRNASSEIQGSYGSQTVVKTMITGAVEPILPVSLSAAGTYTLHEVQNAENTYKQWDRDTGFGKVQAECVRAEMKGRTLEEPTMPEAVRICSTGGSQNTLPTNTLTQGTGTLGNVAGLSGGVVGGLAIPTTGAQTGRGPLNNDFLRSRGVDPNTFIEKVGGCRAGTYNIWDLALNQSTELRNNTAKWDAIVQPISKYFSGAWCEGLQSSTSTLPTNTNAAALIPIPGNNEDGNDQIVKVPARDPSDPAQMRAFWADLAIDIYGRILGQLHNSCVQWKEFEEVIPAERDATSTQATANLAFPWLFERGLITREQSNTYIQFVSTVDAYCSSPRYKIPWDTLWNIAVNDVEKGDDNLTDCEYINPANTDRVPEWKKEMFTIDENTRLRFQYDSPATFSTRVTPNYLQKIKRVADAASREYLRYLLSTIIDLLPPENSQTNDIIRILSGNFELVPDENKRLITQQTERRKEIEDDYRSKLGLSAGIQQK